MIFFYFKLHQWQKTLMNNDVEEDNKIGAKEGTYIGVLT